MHDAVAQTVAGFPIAIVAPPCAGTGYQIGSMSISKGARNIAEAKTFYDWALSVEAQTLALRVNAFQVMSHVGAAKSDKAPDMAPDMAPRHGRNQTDRL